MSNNHLRKHVEGAVYASSGCRKPHTSINMTGMVLPQQSHTSCQRSPRPPACGTVYGLFIKPDERQGFCTTERDAWLCVIMIMIKIMIKIMKMIMMMMMIMMIMMIIIIVIIIIVIIMIIMLSSS